MPLFEITNVSGKEFLFSWWACFARTIIMCIREAIECNIKKIYEKGLGVESDYNKGNMVLERQSLPECSVCQRILDISSW